MHPPRAPATISSNVSGSFAGFQAWRRGVRPMTQRSGRAAWAVCAALLAGTVALAAPVSREQRLGPAVSGSPIATIVSADRRDRAELLRSGPGMNLVVDGAAHPAFTRIEQATIVLAAGGHSAYIAYRGEHPVLVVDGPAQADFQMVGAA